MTSDYVDAVLFQLRWEAIADRDGYFMGIYDDPASSDDVSDDAECGIFRTLDDIIPHEKGLERLRKLPEEAALPVLRTRNLKKLGTADADALKIESESLFAVDNLLAKALQARQRREAAGISDIVEAVQPRKPPPFDTKLVGKRLEVCWPYKEGGKTVKIWASGTVKRVADGLNDKASSRCKKILPAGALLWAWDADPDFDEAAGEKWLILLPNRWNHHVQYAWRYDPCELAPSGAPKPPPRPPQVDDAPSDLEYLTGDES